MNLSLREVVNATHGRLIAGSPGQALHPISIDTRTLRPHETFLALSGPHFDRHDYLRAAAERGASLLILQHLDARLRWRSSAAPSVLQVSDPLKALQDIARWIRARSAARVVGVTGSNGKTTTKEMLACILQRAGPTLATLGNLNNQIGLPLTLCRLAAEHRYAVIEMGTSKPGDMELLAGLARPEVGLITNVGKDHLEFFHSPEGVLKENRLLFDALPEIGIAVINLEDPLLQPLAARLPCRVLTYGRRPEAMIQARETASGASSTLFTLLIEGKAYPCRLEAPGAIQVLNALAAAAAAHALGVAPEHILEGLKVFRPAAMRLQAQAGLGGSLLINDAYNANPSSMRASVQSFCESYSDRPRWLVLGDMRELGPLARAEHEELGRWLCEQPVERIFFYGRDTRFAEAAARAAPRRPIIERFRKKRYLMAALRESLAETKPVVLFKASRAMKLEQVIAPLSAPTSRPAGLSHS